MRLIVSGSRTITDRDWVRRKLDKLTANLKEVVVIVGDARGVDAIAYDWALDHGWTVRKHHADWDKHKKAAGPIRNGEMVEDAGPKGVLIAIWDGKSPGTKNCIDRARKAGLKVRVVRYGQ